ncbi:DUF4179 domain-containing protein [Clostridium polynesiense]|uniref:DUF4179 domain-containing protein n=1 Tax=Clostridium polynesiense TaxID=1325933 RepID=UPI00058FC4C0|nr:DUF4179 domain-containing protein [Clostridium polynesiense]
MNEEVFDNKINEKVKNYNPSVPPIVKDRINSTLNSLNEMQDSTYIASKVYKKNKFFNFKNRKKIIAASLVLAVISTAAIPTYAKKLNIAESIKKHFNIGTKYDKVTDEFGVSRKSSGIEVTINSAIYDGYYLLLDYKVEGDKPFNEKPSIKSEVILTPGTKKIFKNKNFASVSHEYGDFIDSSKKIYEGSVSYRVPASKINNENKPETIDTVMDKALIASKLPENYKLEMDISELSGIKGNWDFNLLVNSEKAKNNMYEYAINKDLTFLDYKAKLDNVVITPIKLYLQGSYSTKDSFLDYILINDKNEVLALSGGETVEYNNDRNYTYAYENFENESEYITVIPYNYYQQKKLTSIPLNLKGKTSVPLGDGRELTITKVEEKDNKTYVYYESEHPVNEYLPFYLGDDEGKTYMRDRVESKTAFHLKEKVVVFEGNLLNKNLHVINNTVIHYNNSFKIPLK